MSELKPITVTDECGSYSVYSKSDVDSVIEEKDRVIEFAKALTLKDIEIIKEKDKEIAELKAQLESEKASRYAESVDAGMRERRLKRALYKACANWMINRQCAMSCFHLEARAKKFDKAIDKCRSMAERYK